MKSAWRVGYPQRYPTAVSVGIQLFKCTLVKDNSSTRVLLWLSRRREFRADRGGARLAGIGSMINALERLRAFQTQPLPTSQLAAFGISGAVGAGVKRLFMTHPPLEERIAALRGLKAA